MKKEQVVNNIILALIAILICLLYKHIFVWLVTKWLDSPEYFHGFFIPLISGYIIWKKKEKIKEISHTPAQNNLGLVVFIGGLLMQIASWRSGVNFICAYSLIIILFGITMYWWGQEMAKELLFPILFLFFMVPFSVFVTNPISFKLKLLSTYLSANTVQLMGIPLYREGVIISLSKGTLEVADPCSGIRSLMAFLMMGTIFAYIAECSMFKKLTLFIITIPLVVLGNTFRIVITLLLLHFQGIIIANTHWETMLGLTVTILVTSGLLLTGKLLNVKYQI